MSKNTALVLKYKNPSPRAGSLSEIMRSFFGDLTESEFSLNTTSTVQLILKEKWMLLRNPNFSHVLSDPSRRDSMFALRAASIVNHI